MYKNAAGGALRSLNRLTFRLQKNLPRGKPVPEGKTVKSPFQKKLEAALKKRSDALKSSKAKKATVQKPARKPVRNKKSWTTHKERLARWKASRNSK
ncbi:MAG TPA: hypothetical protein VMF58_07735 [Rhizomicrobium sp.]|nr:hypothetical protein [Rhizomicrobium sp.]